MASDNGPLGKIVLLTSLAAGVIAIYEWLKNSECGTPGSYFYGSSVCGWLGIQATAAPVTTTTTTTGATPPPVPTNSSRSSHARSTNPKSRRFERDSIDDGPMELLL